MVESINYDINDQNLSAYEKTMICLITSYLQINPTLDIEEWKQICIGIKHSVRPYFEVC